MDSCQACSKRFAAATYRRKFCDAACKAKGRRDQRERDLAAALDAIAQQVELARTALRGRRGSP